MGSQTSCESNVEESKNQNLADQKQMSFSKNYNTISEDYSTGLSKSEVKLKSHLDKLYEEEVSISEVIKQIIKFSIPAFLGVLIRRVTDTINYMAIGRLGDNNQINGGWFAITSVNFVSVAMTVGLAGGIETLSSHAFGSGRNYLAG